MQTLFITKGKNEKTKRGIEGPPIPYSISHCFRLLIFSPLPFLALPFFRSRSKVISVTALYICVVFTL